MADSTLIKPFLNGAIARTNMLHTTDTPEQLIFKLLASPTEIGTITYASKEISRNPKESSNQYYRRVDSEIKKAIREIIGLKKSEPVHYDRLVIKAQIVIFFFISEINCSGDKLILEAKRYGFPLHKVAETILSLRLKLYHLNTISDNYEIEPKLYNSDLYIGALRTSTFKDGKVCVEVLKTNLLLSSTGEISLSLHKKTYKCLIEETFIAESEDSAFLFHHGKQMLRVQETLDAVRFSKRPFMAYSLPEKYQDDPKYQTKGYKNSINFHLTASLNRLTTILDKATINFKPIQFHANYIVDKFVEINEVHSKNIIVIDTIERHVSDLWKNKYHEYLQKEFNAQQVIRLSEAPSFDQLQTQGTSYIVINQEHKKNGSSIIIKDTESLLNGFFDALDVFLKKKDIKIFDYYTSVKLNRFIEKKTSVVQGVNIKNTIEVKNQKDTEGNKSPATTILKKIEKNKLKKIKVELSLKEQVFHENLVKGFSLPAAKLVLFFARKMKKGKSYISVVDVNTSIEGIKIIKQMRYEETEKSRFDFSYPYLKNAFCLNTLSYFDSIPDQGFYIYDTTCQKLLVSYTNSLVPRIIGNAAFDNQERSGDINGINRKRSPQDSVLPYYINPSIKKQLHHVFLDDHLKNELLYFISKAGQPNNTIEMQNRVQKLLVFNKDGSKAIPLEEKITSLFIQSFTFDILNNNEVSKKSILQKIAELYIEN